METIINNVLGFLMPPSGAGPENGVRDGKQLHRHHAGHRAQDTRRESINQRSECPVGLGQQAGSRRRKGMEPLTGAPPGRSRTPAGRRGGGLGASHPCPLLLPLLT